MIRTLRGLKDWNVEGTEPTPSSIRRTSGDLGFDSREEFFDSRCGGLQLWPVGVLQVKAGVTLAEIDFGQTERQGFRRSH